jgi:hypothetical protein
VLLMLFAAKIIHTSNEREEQEGNKKFIASAKDHQWQI